MYKYFGADEKLIKPINPNYKKINNQQHLYDLLSGIWCEYTCAPRMRLEWSKNNKTLGQCSITAFLVQDIFGGNVYGIPNGDGNFHCYNEVNGIIFDLTSEQFGNKKLIYDLKNQQNREIHFKNKEKYERYLYLKKQLDYIL